MRVFSEQPLRHVGETTVSKNEILSVLDGRFLVLSRDRQTNGFAVHGAYSLAEFLRLARVRRAPEPPLRAGELSDFLVHVFDTASHLPACLLAYELPDGRLIRQYSTWIPNTSAPQRDV